MSNLAHLPVNDTRLSDLTKMVREFGRDAAAGGDSLPKLAVAVVRAANDGVINTTKDKDGDDDAARLYREFAEQQSKKAVHEHTKAGVKANTSKLRKLIEFGGYTNADGVEVLTRTIDKRKAMIEAGEKVKPAYAAYVDIARTQLDKDTDLTDDEIAETVRTKVPDEKTAEQVLERIQKTLADLISGEKGIKDQDERITGAHDLIRDRLAAMKLAQEDVKLVAMLAARGLTMEVLTTTEQ